jgi:putative membrane protein
MMGWNDWGAGSWIAMSLMMVLFWGGLILLVVWLVRASRPGRPADRPANPTEHGEEVLADRFARGEIDAEEFEHRRELLHRR